MFVVLWKVEDFSGQDSWSSREYVKGWAYGVYDTKEAAEGAARECEERCKTIIREDAIKEEAFPDDYSYEVIVVAPVAPNLDPNDENSFGSCYGHAE